MKLARITSVTVFGFLTAAMLHAQFICWNCNKRHCTTVTQGYNLCEDDGISYCVAGGGGCRASLAAPEYSSAPLVSVSEIRSTADYSRRTRGGPQEVAEGFDATLPQRLSSGPPD